jgi:NAD-dependent SIR2 family protein deacetylase
MSMTCMGARQHADPYAWRTGQRMVRGVRCAASLGRGADRWASLPCLGRRLCARTSWFGEMPYRMEDRGRPARGDLFVSIGTSGAVYPPPVCARRARVGARCLELNLERSEDRHGSTKRAAG